MVTEQSVREFTQTAKNIFEQISRDIVGQKEVVEGAVIAMIAGGNVLLEGVPGVGKRGWCARWAGYSICLFREYSSPPTSCPRT